MLLGVDTMKKGLVLVLGLLLVVFMSLRVDAKQMLSSMNADMSVTTSSFGGGGGSGGPTYSYNDFFKQYYLEGEPAERACEELYCPYTQYYGKIKDASTG